MKNFLSKFLIFGLFLSFVLGCNVFNKIKQEMESSQTPQIITSDDGKHQITVPGDWKKQTNLNDQASIQAAKPRAELYVVVITDGKDGFGDTVNLDFVTDSVRKNLTESVVGAVFSEPIPVTINGLPAKQFEVKGEVDKIKVTFLYAIVEAPQSFYQVITWTLTPRFENNRGKLLEVINSFKETGIASQPPPGPVRSPAKRL